VNTHFPKTEAMKTKLKVGDYAEVIVNCALKGKILQVKEVNKGITFPYSFLGTAWTFRDSELRKITNKYELLPSLPDLEQYRLSLEVYEQLMTELIMHYEYSQNMKAEEIVDAINEDYNTWQTLTEILEE